MAPLCKNCGHIFSAHVLVLNGQCNVRACDCSKFEPLTQSHLTLVNTEEEIMTEENAPDTQGHGYGLILGGCATCNHTKFSHETEDGTCVGKGPTGKKCSCKQYMYLRNTKSVFLVHYVATDLDLPIVSRCGKSFDMENTFLYSRKFIDTTCIDCIEDILEAKSDEESVEETLRSTTGHNIDPEGVSHPSHYNQDPSGIECIDIVRHRNFNVGNAIKYLWRLGLKNEANMNSINTQIKDLGKVIFYAQDEIERLKKLGDK